MLKQMKQQEDVKNEEDICHIMCSQTVIMSPLLAQKCIYFPKEALDIRKISIFKSLVILPALSSNVNFSLFKKIFGD